MVVKSILGKCSFPAQAVYNCKTKGGAKANGEAEVAFKKKDELVFEQMKDYAEWAMNRVSNG